MISNKKLIIIGAGGFSREVIQLAEVCKREVMGVLDDDPSANLSLRYPKVIGCIQDWINYPEAEFIVTIGNPRIRKKVVEQMLVLGLPRFDTLIHPSICIDKSVSISEGSIICNGTIVTIDISIGKHSIVNINSTVGHDTTIKDYVTVAPTVAISGNVKLESLSEIGTGASIRQGLTIGTGSMLGMGSVATKSLPANEIHIGNPARKFKTIISE